MTARENYDALLREHVGPWLREQGFKKRRNRFRRVGDEGWQVVDFQASQQRVGALLPGGEDHWWPLDASTDAAVLGDELRRVLHEQCLPWLEARRSLDHVMTLAREAPDEFPRYALGRFRMLLERSGLDDLASHVLP